MPVSGTLACPVCGGPARPVFSWTSHASEASYRKRFGEVPSQIEFPSYEMCRCTRCTLEFATPLVPGDDSFYAWVTKAANYYRDHRWEWDVVRDRIHAVETARHPTGHTTVLEIGCGTGNFLSSLSDASRVAAYGCDTHQPSVDACRVRGLEVELGEIHDVFERTTFDVICAFHCLEHVPDPVGFVATAARRLNTGGSVYLSVPYSPTVNDILYGDCLNLPPHHLTRWNAKSLRALAQRLSLRIELLSPIVPFGVIRRAFYALQEWRPGLGGLPRTQVLRCLVQDKVLRAQAYRLVTTLMMRPRLKGAIADDVVLAVCTRS